MVRICVPSYRVSDSYVTYKVTILDSYTEGQRGYYCQYFTINDFVRQLTTQRVIKCKLPFPRDLVPGDGSTASIDMTRKNINDWFHVHPIPSPGAELRDLLLLLIEKENEEPGLAQDRTFSLGDISFFRSMLSRSKGRRKRKSTADASEGDHERMRMLAERLESGYVDHEQGQGSDQTCSSDDGPRELNQLMFGDPEPVELDDTAHTLTDFSQTNLLNSSMEKLCSGNNLKHITESILRQLIVYCEGTSLFLLRMDTHGRIVCEAHITGERTLSLLQRVSLSQVRLPSSTPVIECKRQLRHILMTAELDEFLTPTELEDSVQSILCIPSILQRNFQGCLYLTNSLLPHAFDHINLPLVSLIIGNLLSLINTSALKTRIVRRKSKDLTLPQACYLPGALMQDSMLLFDPVGQAWEKHFLVLTAERLLIFYSPHDNHPCVELLLSKIEYVHVLTGGRQRVHESLQRIPLPTKPNVDESFSAWHALLFVRFATESRWFRIEGVDVAQDWFKILETTRKNIRNGLPTHYLNVPDPLRLREDQVERGRLSWQDSTAMAYDGTWRGHPVVVKEFDKHWDDKEQQVFEKELNMLSQLRHPHIVAVYGGYYSAKTELHTLVFERTEYGPLSGFVNRHESTNFEPLSTIGKLVILSQIMDAVEYLHTRQPIIIHGTLSPDAVLLTESYQVKLANFVASVVGDVPGTVNPASPQSVGPDIPLIWTPPESRGKEWLPTLKGDVYCVGLIMWEVLAQRPMVAVVGEDLLPPYDTMLDFPLGLPEIIRSCWCKDPQLRPTLQILRPKLLRIIENLKNQNIRTVK